MIPQQGTPVQPPGPIAPPPGAPPPGPPPGPPPEDKPEVVEVNKVIKFGTPEHTKILKALEARLKISKDKKIH